MNPLRESQKEEPRKISNQTIVAPKIKLITAEIAKWVRNIFIAWAHWYFIVLYGFKGVAALL